MLKRILSIIMIVLWLVSFVLLVTGVCTWLFFVLLGINLIQLLLIGLRAGRENGVSIPQCILMCMIFGVLWWLPMQRR